MFKRKSDRELESMSDADLANLSLTELQRIRNKRWAWQKSELTQRADNELKRRDPRKDWKCERCESSSFHEKRVRMIGSFTASLFGVETETFHVVICS